MRTIKQYLEAAKARKENGEAGFSLVELIVVVVILGILAAVAIPIFNGIQAKARQNGAAAAAGNAASQIVAGFAEDPSGYTIDVANFNSADNEWTVAATGTGIDDVCVTVTGTNITTETSGPGC